MLKPVKARAYNSLFLMVGLLLLTSILIFLFKDVLTPFFYSKQLGVLGIILNLGIVALFLMGLVRMMALFISYAHEEEELERFVERVKDNAANPLHKLDSKTLIVQRVNALQVLYDQNAEINQGSLGAIVAAGESARFTLVRFVHNILIISGVFGTVVSLSVALFNAEGLLNTPDDLQKMGAILGGMSTALKTTITAILCYAAFSYFHLRLQDIRTQLLANLEQVTTLYIMPHFRTTEVSILNDVSILTTELRQAAEAVTKIQERFLQAGDRLQLAVDDLQGQISTIGHALARTVETNSEDLRVIRESIREGFRLDERPHTPSLPKTSLLGR
ncbi:MAG: hypothetical protein E6Q83_05180 [Thiothrix sp.]|nr:MAG: hypothetical protein E6Q83_05180 [Thiothrix sp.]